MKDRLTYLAFGAGVQSTAMLVLSNRGELGVPRADVAIFADTGDEPSWVYEQVEQMTEWSDIPVEVVSKGERLSDAFLDRAAGGRKSAATIPLWVKGDLGRGAPLRRNCTRDYKIRPMQRHAIRLMDRTSARGLEENAVQCLLGISTDEASRMTVARERWLELCYPLIDARPNRDDCARIVREAGLGEPRKSACIYCPFHSTMHWAEIKKKNPDEFKRAVEFDRKFRDLAGSKVKGRAYVHPSLKPLEDIDLDEIGLFGPMWDEECTGHCGV